MCWSGEASLGLAATGFISTAWFYRKGKEAVVLYSALAYFLMEDLINNFV